MGTKDESGLQAWRAMLLASNAALRAIDADLTRSGTIPLTWYDVLLELNAGPERRLRMNDLAERVVLSRTRVSRLVDEMVLAGLVTKVRDEADRRVVRAAMTDEGVRAFRATAPQYLRGIEQHFSQYLTDEEKKVMATALQRVREAHGCVIATPDSLRRNGRNN
ncbi:MarR family winged helix-turn-helix transcriptional regulator [Amycolatopsis granulosa]|uniref:MarR family winged helix-turn-helix transcriptional regulator n=1 Tax=Amycolatopsis granulosa TaxID=185684 RepID=UPI00141E3F83|nr:MarR family winged helix-turn-helix transcriptional regulator [Amycolatopsis granulosa]NIH84675.1 DNA-binding MarR family transcriptional regulator [Amycolatopsis granulosa]